MAKKKKNSRKALAVALGIMGVAGLGIASASNLNITASPDNLATGVATFGDACDTDVAVAYTTGGTAIAPTYTGYVISDIAAACAGKSLTSTLGYSTFASNTYTPAVTPLSNSVPSIAAPISPATMSAVTVVFATPLAGNSRLDTIAITIK